jgi:hypothetical protein
MEQAARYRHRLHQFLVSHLDPKVRLDHSALKVQRVQRPVGQLVLLVQQVQPEEVEDLASRELALEEPVA